MLEGSSSLLMVFYAGGFALVFGVLSLQTYRAYRSRSALELDEVEGLVTRSTLRMHLVSVAVGVAALTATLVGVRGDLAGWVFLTLGPAHGILGAVQGARVRRLGAERGL